MNGRGGTTWGREAESERFSSRLSLSFHSDGRGVGFERRINKIMKEGRREEARQRV